MKQEQTCINPIEDQRKQALEHYNELATKCSHWSSFVENAIKAYNPKSNPEAITPASVEEIVCGLDEQQCQQECKHKSDRAKCPFVTVKNIEVDTQFRMIISHALLGCDTSDVDRQTWDLVFSECTKYCLKYSQAKDKEIDRLDFTVFQKWFDEKEKKMMQADIIWNHFQRYYIMPLKSRLTAKEAEIKEFVEAVKKLYPHCHEVNMKGETDYERAWMNLEKLYLKSQKPSDKE